MLQCIPHACRMTSVGGGMQARRSPSTSARPTWPLRCTGAITPSWSPTGALSQSQNSKCGPSTPRAASCLGWCCTPTLTVLFAAAAWRQGRRQGSQQAGAARTRARIRRHRRSPGPGRRQARGICWQGATLIGAPDRGLHDGGNSTEQLDSSCPCGRYGMGTSSETASRVASLCSYGV